jgi:integrase
MDAAKGTALEAYIVVSFLSGVRTEEARALRWDHVVAWVDGQWEPVRLRSVSTHRRIL